jgi:nucleoid-associated protein YgaU
MGIFDYWKREKPRPELAPPAPPPQAGGDPPPVAPLDMQTYVVIKGDTLSTIASGQYGNAQKWTRIYEANRDLIADPDLIYPGQQLRIPD